MFIEDDNEYLFCPEAFRFNCASYQVKCYECGACAGEFSQLHYLPIAKDAELTKKNHPFLVNQKKVKKDAARKDKLAKRNTTTSRVVKKSLKAEKKNITQLGGRLTVGSGRVFGDGDGYTTINDIKYYIEHKKRFSDNGSMFPTSTEYQKGVSQGAKLFVIESIKGTTVSMSKETFMEILGL